VLMRSNTVYPNFEKVARNDGSVKLFLPVDIHPSSW
jgi:hypothetical protein